MTKKEFKNFVDSINGGAIALAMAMNETVSRDGDENYSVKKSILLDRIAAFSDMAGLRKVNTINAADVIYDAVNMRTIRFTKGDFKALSGSGFRKWFREFVESHFDVALIESVETEKTTRKTRAQLEQEIETLRAMLAK